MCSRSHRVSVSGRVGCRGFTLVEVVVAVAIMGIGLGVLMTAAVRCLKIMSLAKTYQRVEWALKRGELDYPLVFSNELDELEVSGETYEVQGQDFVFSRFAEDDDEDEDNLWKITTRVSWARDGYDAYDEIVQYVYYDYEDVN